MPEPLPFPPHLRAHLDPFLPATAPPSNSSHPSPLPDVPLRLPHLTLTYATSLDSQISLSPGVQTLLSSLSTKAMTHYLRANHDAILIGVGTARADNPSLNSRFSEEGEKVVGLERQPIPVILDPRATWRASGKEKVFELAGKGEGKVVCWLVGEDMPFALGREWFETYNLVLSQAHDALLTAGKYRDVDVREQGVDWEATLIVLAKRGIRSVMVEGGAVVINDLLRERNQKFVSSLVVTIAPTYLGRGGVVVAPPRTEKVRNEARLRDVKWVPMGEDVVMLGKLM